MRPATPRLRLSHFQRAVLDAVVASPLGGRRDLQRAHVLLLADEGLPNTLIGQRVGVAPATVAVWRQRFLEEGLQYSPAVRPGRGRKSSIPQSTVAAIVGAVTRSIEMGSGSPSVRSLAHDYGVSAATVQRVLAARGLGQSGPFDVAANRRTDGSVDAVGLYLNPPDQTLALAMNAEGEVQAFGPGDDVAMARRPGIGKRRGAGRVSLLMAYAAIASVAREVVGQSGETGRSAAFLGFLTRVNERVSDGSRVHLISTNYAIRGQADVQAWLGHHRDFYLHLVPTSALWLLSIAEIFGRIQEIGGPRFRALPAAPSLIGAIERYFGQSQMSPEPFAWTRP